MIKKWVVFIAIMMLTCNVWSYETCTINGITWTYTVVNGEASLGAEWPDTAVPSSTIGDIEIPSSINGFPVTRIGVDAFLGCTSLTSVIIPDSVTYIGDYAFNSLSSLTNLVIPASVRSVGEDAFSGCDNVVSAVLPGHIDFGVWSWNSLERIAVAEGTSSILDSAFYGSDTLIKVTIPDGVVRIGSSAFESCSLLGDIEIPASVTNIGDYAFNSCSSLTNITWIGDLSSVDFGKFVFEETPYNEKIPFTLAIDNSGVLTGFLGTCPADVVIPEGVVEIGEDVFYRCYSMLNVTFPSTLTNIKANAFRECSSLEELNLSANLQRIGNYAFAYCRGLKSVVYEGDKDSIEFGNDVFMGTIFEPFVLNIDDNGVLRSFTGPCPAHLVIPEGVVAIASWVFEYCDEIESVMLPASLESIGNGVFGYCENLEYVEFSSNIDEIEMDIYSVFGGTPCLYSLIDPPENDNRNSATVISGTSGTVTGMTYCATSETPDLIVDEIDEDYSSTVWYAWTAPSNGKFSFSVSDVDSSRGWSCYIGTASGYNETDGWTDSFVDWRYITIEAVQGESYLIEIGSHYSEEFRFDLAWGEVPTNDEFENAQTLDNRESGSISGSLLGATIADNDCILQYGDAARTVWYKWVAPITGQVTFSSIADNGKNSLLYLVATRGYDEETEEWDDCGYDYGRSVTFDAVEGETYYISVATWNYVVNGFELSWVVSLPPSNDNFADAAELSGDSGSVEGTNRGATQEEFESGLGLGQSTVWWRWTAPLSCIMRFDTLGSGFDTIIGVFTENESGLYRVARNDDCDEGEEGESLVSFQAVSGMTYYIAVSGYSTATGDVVLNWNAFRPPANDAFADAEKISGVSGSVEGTNINASFDDFESDLGLGDAIVWWKWTAPASGDATFDTLGSYFDTMMGVYTQDGESLVEMAYNDDCDESAYNESLVTFLAKSGTTYYIAVSGYLVTTGDIVLNWNVSSDAIPELDESATAKDVAVALDGSADSKLLSNITTIAEYEAYRTWAMNISGATLSEVKDSPCAWLSYALNSDTLIEQEPVAGDVAIDTFSNSATVGAFDFTVNVKDITVGDGALEANIRKVFDIEGVEDLATGTFSADAVEVNEAAAEGGKVKFTVTPVGTEASRPASFFFKVRMK